ncbi:hypothetical protein PsSCT_36880 [Pseudomonas sp. SCT]
MSEPAGGAARQDQAGLRLGWFSERARQDKQKQQEYEQAEHGGTGGAWKGGYYRPP